MRIALFLLKTLFDLAVVGIAGSIMVLCAVFLYLDPQLPPVEVLKDVRLQTPLRIYSADGVLIGEYGDKRRTPLDADDIPQDMINAFLAAEDDRFYEHHGVDVTGLARAVWQLVSTGEIQTGGSTITMQVAKNYFLTKERTFSRKLNEIFLAMDIEREMTKAQILELYVNKIFLGNHAYGIEAAAKIYYGKSIGELTLAQHAMLAGLPKAPSTRNPLANPERALQRRNWILGRMNSLGYIDKKLLEETLLEPVTAEYHGTVIADEAGYVAEMVRQEMIQRYGEGAYTEGYKVYTTVDSKLQKTALRAVVNGLADYDSRHGYRGPELVIQDFPQTLPEDMTPYLAMVKKYRRVGIWHAALVTEVNDTSFKALFADGTSTEVTWEQGIKGTRLFIDENRRTAEASLASDVVERGDIVRLKNVEDSGWHLSQIPKAQGALVSLDADTGAILSLVGGIDYFYSPYNRITQAERQPGSNFKPFLYAAALENGFTAATIINDAPIVVNDKALEGIWRPENASGKFDGPTRLRKALYRSRNLVSIRLLRQLGINPAIDYMANFGFNTSKLPKDLSLALGSYAATPLEVVEGYAVFANGGYGVKPWFIERVENSLGEVVDAATYEAVCREPDCNSDEASEAESSDDAPLFAEQAKNEQGDSPTIAELLEGSDAAVEDDSQTEELDIIEAKPIPATLAIDARVAYMMDSILKDVILRGTGTKAKELGRNDLAGKTGTTNGPIDLWFSGYGGGVVTTTWVGFDQNELLGRREFGGSVALPIWMEYMNVALADKPKRELEQPPGLVTVRIDPETGELASSGQQDAIFEIFMTENAPKREGLPVAGELDDEFYEEETPAEEIF